MNGFFILDVPEFQSLIGAALESGQCRVHGKRGHYRFVEFENEVDILRGNTDMSEAVWFGCLTGGLCGKIVRFDAQQITLRATNEPILKSE
jgi:hypothetical protein